MTIGDVAKAVGVDRRTIRYYERRGLLNCSRTPSRYRLFGEHELLSLKLIRSLRRLDFSIPEIARLLPMLLKPKGPKTSSAKRLKEILTQRLHRVDEQLRELTVVHQTLTQRVGRLASLKTPKQDSCCEPFCGPETCAPRFIQIQSPSSNRNRGKEVTP